MTGVQTCALPILSVKELRVSQRKCYVKSIKCVKKIKSSFTSVGAFSSEQNFSRGNPEGPMEWISHEAEAFGILEDEKVYGTVHIAFGTNTSFGGVNKADCHMDGIILKPDLYLDDVQVIRQGEFVL